MQRFFVPIIFILCCFLFLKCHEKKGGNPKTSISKTKEKKASTPILKKKPEGTIAPAGMVWIPGGHFEQGAVNGDPHAMNHEKPRHLVAVDGFFMDTTEVTNRQFEVFVKETGYITVAERKLDWSTMKQQLPPGTEKPHDSIFQPGSMTFQKASAPLSNLNDFSQWWRWTVGANWKHPEGPNSTIEGKEDHPVVHIAYEDAIAYCDWAGRRLPTEAEWEYASRGGNEDAFHFWGNATDNLINMANTWTGEFPHLNDKKDGYTRTAPVASYKPNNFKLYDMAGNVWEWTSDWFNTTYYRTLLNTDGAVLNPSGPTEGYNPNNPYAEEKVIKGGSFLCHESYCASYRISSRMATTPDSATEHLGFRTVVDLESVASGEDIPE